MSKFVIFDCDNVLSDDSWRIPLIKWDKPGMFERYHAYHLASAFDAPGNRTLLRGIRAEDVIIFTAMPEHYRVMRHLWFNHNRIGFNKIYMRPEGNHAHSAELKRAMLHQFYEDFGAEPQQIKIAYDDRPDVVEMFAKEGVQSEVVCIHNVSAYHAPKLEIA